MAHFILWIFSSQILSLYLDNHVYWACHYLLYRPGLIWFLTIDHSIFQPFQVQYNDLARPIMGIGPGLIHTLNLIAYNMMIVSGPSMLMGLAQCDCCAWPNMCIGLGSIHTLNLFKSNMIIGPGPSWVLGLAQYPLWARPNMFIGPGPIHTLNLFKSNMMIGPGPSLVLGLALSDYWARPNNDIELAYFW